MTEVTCVKCNGSGHVWPKLWLFSWRATCNICKGKGTLDHTAFYHPKGLSPAFGQRKAAPFAVTPSYFGRPTVPIDQPLPSPAPGELDEGTLKAVMNAIAKALQLDLQPSDPGQAH